MIGTINYNNIKKMCAQIRARIGLWHVFSQFDLLFFAAAATAIALITEWPSWVTNEHFPTKESVEQLIIALCLELLEMTYLATCIIRYGNSEEWRNNVRNITHLQWVLMCICPLYRNSNVSITLCFQKSCIVYDKLQFSKRQINVT